MVSLPRLVIAAPASGQGKTTVAVGLMAALSRAGHAVAAAKVGPDYIDPGYHALATGRPGRNLDPWLQGESLIAPLLRHAAATPSPADITVIEGVMGLFDGRLGTQGWASTAHVARLTRSPVVLVVDIGAASRTVAAVVHGLRTFDPEVSVAGVILNKSGSPRHAADVQGAVERLGLPVLGVLPRDAGVHAPSRHLGLVPVAERPDAVDALDRLTEQSARFLDLDGLLEVARSAPALPGPAWQPPVRRALERDSTGEGPQFVEPAPLPRRIVAVAGGRTFTFRYTETDELLRAQGCEPVVFDPARDGCLPPGTAGLFLGGGFPEVHASALARNGSLLTEIRDAVSSGVPTVAECAGLLYLAEALDGHPLTGILPTKVAMSPRLALRYRAATTQHPTLLAEPGEVVHGHEFHRTRATPGHGIPPAWLLDGEPDGWSLDPARTGSPTVHASYLHVHWAGHPELAARFADAVHGFARACHGPAADLTAAVPTTTAPTARLVAEPMAGDPLEHHGDTELDPSLIDLAVNVRLPEPPAWLADRLRDGIRELAAYPRVDRARAALANAHDVEPSMVLPTSGAAEAFVLLAHALRPRHPVVVHPQFTEPEAALRRAGHDPERLVLRPENGFAFDPGAVPATADLVVIGNPTNPTGVLHDRRAIAALRRPGRTLVVDEAFMDSVPGEPESLLTTPAGDLTGVLIVRSLTKTWGLAGLRAGYVVGDPELLTALARHQPHWSVSTPAALVMEATATPQARAEADRSARDLDLWRSHLVRGLHDLGLRPVNSRTAFVLVDAGAGVREALRERGYAVRRGDSFPGLGPTWVRIAVRDPHTTDGFLLALAAVLGAREASA